MIVIYHGRCLDGFTAAWVAWLKFGDAAEYHPAHYGAEPPAVAGQDVLIVDFSYPRPTILKMAEAAKSLRLLDHHKTAQADLDGFSIAGPLAAPGRLEIVFDMTRSGARLAWDELHSNLPRPKLIDYVEDRDLWRFNLPESELINAVIGIHEQRFRAWSHLAEQLESRFDQTVTFGRGIVAKIDNYVAKMCEEARWLDINGARVPVVNTPYINTSEVVGKLAETHAAAPFAVGWYQRADGVYAYSLRSRNDFDVSAVAKSFGGGGHRNAAGFQSTMPPDALFGKVVS